MSDTVIIVGGFGDEELLPVLVEGFRDAGCEVVRIKSRGVIAEHRDRDMALAAKEIIPMPRIAPTWQTEDDWCNNVRSWFETSRPQLLLWWYAKDDRPAGLVESLSCPTVRFSWDDPMSLDVYGEDWSRGFTHAVTSCQDSLDHYRERGVKAMWTLPPVSPTIHGQAMPMPHEECDIAATFYTLYDGEADYLCERAKRRELIEAAAGLGEIHVYGGYGRNSGFRGVPRASFRGFRTTHEMPGVFAAAKIVTGHHPQCNAGGYVAPRDMEAIASGACLLSDNADGIVKHLPQVPTYSTLGDFTVRARWLLQHDRERQAMASECRRYVLNQYSGKRFAERVLEFVE